MTRTDRAVFNVLGMSVPESEILAAHAVQNCSNTVAEKSPQSSNLGYSAIAR